MRMIVVGVNIMLTSWIGSGNQKWLYETVHSMTGDFTVADHIFSPSSIVSHHQLIGITLICVDLFCSQKKKMNDQ